MQLGAGPTDGVDVKEPLQIAALNASIGRIARLRGSAPEGPECARKPPFRTECEIGFTVRSRSSDAPVDRRTRSK